MGSTRILPLLLCVLAIGQHLPAQAQAEPAQRYVRLMTWTGLAAGIGMDVFYLATIHTGYETIDNWLVVPGIMMASSVLNAGAITLGFRLLGQAIVRWDPPLALDLVVGPVYGAAVGALATGLTLGTAMAIGIPTGAITVNPDAAFMGNATSFWDGLSVGFRGGAMFGAVFGGFAGLAGVPASHLGWRIVAGSQ